jgi:dTDP-glucose 4,6-dehydratase
MSRVVLTGGAGFIGSHLARRLLDRGDEVVVLDNLVSGRIENLHDLVGRAGFEFGEVDVSRGIVVDGPVDGVMHLASPASPPEYLALPLETLDAGSLGTRNALELAREHGARFLLASTSEIYGDPLVHPQPEDYRGNVDPLGPRAVYDEAKRFAETLTITFHRLYGVSTAILRIFNTYGPNLRPGDGRVVSNFLVQAIDGLPLTVYGDGTQSRSYCYVDDQVRGILAFFDSDFVGPVNVGNTDEYTVLELAHMVLDVTGSRSEIVFEDLPVDDPVRRCPDVRRARELFGWTPEVTLRDGLGRTHAWYLQERARGDA